MLKINSHYLMGDGTIVYIFGTFDEFFKGFWHNRETGDFEIHYYEENGYFFGSNVRSYRDLRIIGNNPIISVNTIQNEVF